MCVCAHLPQCAYGGGRATSGSGHLYLMGLFAGILGEILKGTDSLSGAVSSGLKGENQDLLYSMLAGSQPSTRRRALFGRESWSFGHTGK